MSDSSMLERALFYRNAGLSVIPITGPHYATGRTYEEKAKASKAALVRWIDFQTRFATEEEIESWFLKWPRANIGFVTGRISGVVVVDFDSEEAVQDAQRQGYLNTPCVRTGRGLHAYFQYPYGKELRNFVDKLSSTDLRADGGAIILPPSRHFSGRAYVWVRNKGIADLPFAPLPDAILKKALNTPGRISRDEIRNLYKGRSEGDRNHTLARLCGSWVNDGLRLEEALEMAEVWNHGNKPPLCREELIRTIKSIFRYRKKVRNPEKDLFTENHNIFRLPLLGKRIVGDSSEKRIWQVSPSIDPGRGEAFDEEVFKAVNQIVAELPKPLANPVYVESLKKVAELIGIKGPKIEDYRAMRQALKRIGGLVFSSTYTGHNGGNGMKHVDSTFHLFDKVVFQSETRDGKTVHSTFIWLSDTYLKAIGRGYNERKT